MVFIIGLIQLRFSKHWEGFSKKFGFVDCFVKVFKI